VIVSFGIGGVRITPFTSSGMELGGTTLTPDGVENKYNCIHALASLAIRHVRKCNVKSMMSRNITIRMDTNVRVEITNESDVVVAQQGAVDDADIMLVWVDDIIC